MSGGLRLWQRRCISQAMAHYAVSPHFFCQATPGAGKTRMAAELAKRLLDEGKIDLVLCFAPSCQVVEGFRTTFSSVLSRRLDGRIGAIGSAYTYQAMEFRDQDFWSGFRCCRKTHCWKGGTSCTHRCQRWCDGSLPPKTRLRIFAKP